MLRINASYFLRTGEAGSDRGHSGRRFGEIELREAGGSLFYMPRGISTKEIKGISFRYRKSDPDATCFFRFYRFAHLNATIEETPDGLMPVRRDTDWHEITIPMSALKSVEEPAYPEG